ncbi:hypothetical protein BTJ49_04105 [Oleiagrimonas sp. MCCC 1A03011]|nr:hypothetical protein BTJ49_04105 [Oleiagrimonas sp. MCCC 1A03011]
MKPLTPEGANPSPKPAIQAILSAFDHYEVVAMSAGHADKDMDDFIFRLIRNPAFPEKVDDIVVECGNSLYQPLLDRYIAGADVSLDDARKVWRNTTQPMCGVSGFYDQLFPLIRRINRTLPEPRKIRVLAGDPPIDWSKIRNHADLMRQDFSRDANIARVMERQVLSKHRTALMLFGVDHLFHDVKDSAVGKYERKYPGKTFVVAKHDGFGLGTPYEKYDRPFEKRMASWPSPSLVTLKGTWLADLLSKLPSTTYSMTTKKGPNGHDITTYVPNDIDKVTAKTVDAYLYLGPARLALSEAIPAYIFLDTKYVHELRRRARIVDNPVYDQSLPSHVFDTDHSRFLHAPPPAGSD